MGSATTSRLGAQLRELDSALRARGIAYAAIGGIAMNAHGFVRATRDVDLLVLAEDADAVRALALNLGYRVLDESEGISSYVRNLQRFDVMHAQRPISRNLLQRARDVDLDDMRVPIVPLPHRPQGAGVQ